MKTILTPIDFSIATEGVIEAACALAGSRQARILLLHVVQPPVLTSDYGIALENFQEAIEVSEKHAEKRLAEFKERIQALQPGLVVETKLVSGPPVSEILGAAHDADTAYIVMGSHGHNALYDLLVGTTTHGVLHRAKYPVVIVPPPQRIQQPANEARQTVVATN